MGGRLHVRGHRQDAGPIRNPIGCNMAFRRRELPSVGSFETRFGKRAEALETCDETELSLRLERVHGPGRIRYVPAARVQHLVPASAVSWRLLVRRSLSEGLAKGRLQRLYARLCLGTERSYVRCSSLEAVPRLLLTGFAGAIRTPRSGAVASRLAGRHRRAFRRGVARAAQAQETPIRRADALIGLCRRRSAAVPPRMGRRWLDHVGSPCTATVRAGAELRFHRGDRAALLGLAAKAYSAHAVGLNSALISA